MTTSTDLDVALRLVLSAAHSAAIDAERRGETTAVAVNDAVREALRCGVANGLLQLTPRGTWPRWITGTAPYRRVETTEPW